MNGETAYWARPPNEANPDPETLQDHAAEVAAFAQQNTPDTATLSDGTPLQSFLRMLGWVHDIGKATTWFQEKIENDRVPSVEKPSPNADTHSPLGGPVTWWMCRRVGFSKYSSLLGVIAVARHHGTIPTVSQYVSEHLLGDNKRWKLIKAQTQNINQFAPEVGTQLLESAWKANSGEEALPSLSWGEVTEAVAHGEIREEIWKTAQSDFGSGLTEAFSHDYLYDDLLALWGGLKAADTLAAAGGRPHGRSPEITAEAVNQHIASLPEATDAITTTLNKSRESARQDALAAATASGGGPGIYTITLPTGAGKTLTGTQAALRLREEYGATGPLIYALPYTSIIDQTASTFETVFNAEYPSTTLSVHHHLAPTESNTGLPTAKQLSRLARDSWQSDLTLTTFVQLWESLTGPQQAQATKIPALYGSTIILDEPQTLPLTWWPAVEHLFDMLVDDYSARVILMSATQPKFNTGHDPVSLTEDTEISIPDRTSFTFGDSAQSNGKPLEIAAAAEQICDSITSGAASILSIQNTVSSTRAMLGEIGDRLDHQQKSIHDVYSSLLDADAETLDDALPTTTKLVAAVRSLPADTVLTCPLTSRHRPCDRRIIINALKEILETANEQPESSPTIVAVTTQLVEAGVDMSFEYLFRDLAPYDSVFHPAGRCNRNYEFGQGGGTVTVWKLNSHHKSASARIPSQAVYGAGEDATVNRLSLTQEVIHYITEHETADPRSSIRESTATGYHEEYQQLLQSRRPKNSDISTAIESCSGDQLTPASIIEERPSVSVIISRTAAGDELLSRYRTRVSRFEFEKVDAVLHELRRLQTDIPPSRNSEQSITEIAYQLEQDLYALTSRQIKTTDAYLPDVGAQHPTDTVESRFI